MTDFTPAPISSRTVIVTGASQGLGAAIAHTLGRLGANVVLNARGKDELERVAEQVRANGGQAEVVPGDISVPETSEILVARALEVFERVDSVVNNAATLDPLSQIQHSQPQAWAQAWATNVLGPLQLAQAALPYLREQRGRVINIVSSIHRLAGWGAFSATKAALVQFGAVLSAEERDVTVVNLRPGVMDTPMQERVREEGGDAMATPVHSRFIEQYYEGELLNPDGPGTSAAVLALFAPLDWSGHTIDWDDERLRRLGERNTQHGL